ncbi:unnamed protein product [Chilo suppressalis]|uniref:receptor protein-tyrosine kinase n=1 Tax=Chilo suppressalis TaxID=168631 RepID=A0ABN8ARY0_CHISP|nr:unnamed protein product [Chilo suppressalis]
MKSGRSCWLFIALGVILTSSPTTAYYGTDEKDQEDIDGPIIIPQKTEVVLQQGQNFTLICRGKRRLQIRQQEIPEELIGAFSMEERILESTDVNYPFEIALDLFNVDQYAVGYYACYDDAVDSDNILNDLMEEPSNTEHISYIYIYVNGTDVLFAPMLEYFVVPSGSKAILRCKPTMPDIIITLSLVKPGSKTPEYKKFSPKIGFLIKANMPSYRCDARRGNHTSWKLLKKREDTWTPKLRIDKADRYFIAGENFTLTCSVKYQLNSPVALQWDIPPKATCKFINVSNELNVTPGENLFNTITAINATKDDEGYYSCILSGGLERKKIERTEKIFIDEPFLNLKKSNEDAILETKVKIMTMTVEVSAYPPPKFSVYRDNEPLQVNNSKYKLTIKRLTGDLALTITDLNVNDTANYTIEGTNGYVTKTVTYDLRKTDKPKVSFRQSQDIILLVNTQKTLVCEALGYPLPFIEWKFNGDPIPGIDEKQSVYKVISKLKITAYNSGNITCTASNTNGTDFVSIQLFIYEISNGFGIQNRKEWYPENQEVSIRCLASFYKFSNSSWYGPNDDDLAEYVQYSQSPFSHVAKLKINQVSMQQAGSYTCVGYNLNGTREELTTDIVVEEMREPVFIEPIIDRDEEVRLFQQVSFSCAADAIPIPEVEWHKDGELLENKTDDLVMYVKRNHSVVNSTIYIERMNETNKGKYECVVIYHTKNYHKSKFVNLIMKDSMPYKSTILSVVIVVILILIILVIYLTWKIRKEKRFRKELAAAGLWNFKKGTGTLNPDLGIDEQAELLPYDEKFEFPPEKLTLGKQLGAGAFGVVYKAEARGIINAEETTPVAVKMVKKTADNMYIKALASELKIMVHMGKHVNIVNLLGACTQNVGKRELIVIVEYCKFGNIHNYMQKHREVFIDQFTDNKEKNLGKVNKGYSCSSASSGINSDYFGTNHTQATYHTALNTANTNRSGRKVSETGYVQPEWRSNYESDYSFDGRNPRPLTSRDLLAWAFQIARGMEYLASRKVLHGDLAARNVLLAEDNIVKICDFGLARSIYKNDEYQKKENSPLPVKWLAIECMTDRIFSTQSDVWSFGIVLWEMFSLAKTPYPNMSPQYLLQWLSEGHRLEKPTYADDRLYDVMMRCWSHKPNARPSFTHLQELLGSFLEDNVRNHYVDLNSTYMDLNVKSAGQEDYLAMVSAPDYNNLVTPSPHHYVNDVRSFFPPTPNQVPLDEEGYLQMTPMKQNIFSPRSPSTKFDFDSKKFDPKVAEGCGGSELTPMLTLNNLPARSGSDSDHEGHSPYLNMCPKIVEESDDVFKPTHNNLKNTHNSAVTNPTYITLDVDGSLDKKPKDINNYINVPNGLVK